MKADPDDTPLRPALPYLQSAAHGGLSPDDLSRIIVVYDSGFPRTAGWPVGYVIWVSAKHRVGWLREDFGPARDVIALARARRRFLQRLEDVVPIDWRLPSGAFQQSVSSGIVRHFPELSHDARQVLMLRFNHLRCNPVAAAVGQAISARLARRAIIRPVWHRITYSWRLLGQGNGRQ
jgi:hypothetical protein